MRGWVQVCLTIHQKSPGWACIYPDCSLLCAWRSQGTVMAISSWNSDHVNAISNTAMTRPLRWLREEYPHHTNRVQGEALTSVPSFTSLSSEYDCFQRFHGNHACRLRSRCLKCMFGTANWPRDLHQSAGFTIAKRQSCHGHKVTCYVALGNIDPSCSGGIKGFKSYQGD